MNPSEQAALNPRPRYTVFIPTFNRRDTLPRALDSALAQTFRDFEILVVDDGSSDGTEEVARRYEQDADCPFRYVWQPNQGKHVAYNLCAKLAHGEFIVLLDSDDVLLPKALEYLDQAWSDLPVELRDRFAGVEGLCEDATGRLHGTPFPQDPLDCDYITAKRRFGVSGEKRHSLRTDLLRAYPYPVISGETHVRPDFVWKLIATRYRIRHINRVLQVVEFRADGLTRNARLRRLRNPGGLYLYYRNDLLQHPQHLSPAALRRVYGQYVRYGLRHGIGLRRQLSEVPRRLSWLLALPRGIGDYLLDGLKAAQYRRKGIRV